MTVVTHLKDVMRFCNDCFPSLLSHFFLEERVLLEFYVYTLMASISNKLRWEFGYAQVCSSSVNRVSHRHLSLIQKP